ncbi:MAG: hypothetical protein K6G90_06565 [Clostridia bacterium]|nr:hypothetical protein [Clostridia bacterium]
MFESITNDLCRIKTKLNREKAFELSPVYLLSDQTGNHKDLLFFLNLFRSELEKNGCISKSSIFTAFSISYNIGELKFGLADESGNFRGSLDQWLTYYKNRFHIECGIVLIDIPCFSDVPKDHAWRKILAKEINENKTDFLFFISVKDTEIENTETLLLPEVFTVRFEMTDFSIDDYTYWFAAKAKENGIIISETDKTTLRDLFARYEHDLNRQTAELWLKELLWLYYTSENDNACFLPPELTESSLIRSIEKNHRKVYMSGIGFN